MAEMSALALLFSRLILCALEELRVKFSCAIGAHAMAEIRFGVIPNIDFELIPVAAVIADFLACGADGEKSIEDFDLADSFIDTRFQNPFSLLELPDSKCHKKGGAGDESQDCCEIEEPRLVKMRL